MPLDIQQGITLEASYIIETKIAEPTAAEVADFTPETVPDKFMFNGRLWTVSNDESGKKIWTTEGLENVSMSHFTLYDHYIKDMFMEVTRLGRFNLLVTPESRLSLRFSGDPQISAQIGEEIITQYLIPEMKEQEALNAILNGADVYAVYGHIEKNRLPAIGDGYTYLYSEDGSERIGKLKSVKGISSERTQGAWQGEGPYVNPDGSVIFGSYFNDVQFLDPLIDVPSSVTRFDLEDIFSRMITSVVKMVGGLPLGKTNYIELGDYFKQVATVEQN